MNTSIRVVLDTSAPLAFVRHEPGAEIVEKLLPVSVVSPVSVAEIVLITSRRGYSGSVIGDLRAMGLQIAETTPVGLASRAGELLHLSKQEEKQHRDRSLSLADAMILALAESMDLPAVTGDKLWLELQHLIKVPVELFRP
ncbi:PIN domain-containing protein (plasmid) [Kitasatospora griseola]|uniref:PIN domain-containing protein n=1 Tax=Kitasatospora griseola TaxID=2064 RepID=UPI0038560E7D